MRLFEESYRAVNRAVLQMQKIWLAFHFNLPRRSYRSSYSTPSREVWLVNLAASLISSRHSCRGKVSAIEMWAGRGLTVWNPTALLQIPFDIWDRILSQEHLKAFGPRASELVVIQTVCWQAASLVQPHVYRHVNILDLDAFTSFSGAVAGGLLDPGQWVRTLQISFNTGGLSKQFFKDMSKTIFALKHLHCLIFCYSHRDLTFVRNLRKLATSFPPSLKELHIKPIFEECWRNCPSNVCFSHYTMYSS